MSKVYVEKIWQAELPKTADILNTYLMIEVPRGDTMRLAKSRRIKFTRSGFIITIGTRVPYFKYVIGGTGPHRITAKHRKALNFGSDKPYAAVEHPGTEPNDFIERARNRARPEIRKLLKRITRQIVEAIER